MFFLSYYSNLGKNILTAHMCWNSLLLLHMFAVCLISTLTLIIISLQNIVISLNIYRGIKNLLESYSCPELIKVQNLTFCFCSTTVQKSLFCILCCLKSRLVGTSGQNSIVYHRFYSLTQCTLSNLFKIMFAKQFELWNKCFLTYLFAFMGNLFVAGHSLVSKGNPQTKQHQWSLENLYVL